MGTRGDGNWSTIACAVILALGVVGLAACSDGSDDAGSSGAPTTEAVADASGGSFSLLSYNVAGLPAEISQEHPDVNIPLISPHLADYDVVITQEDFDWWPEGGLASGLDFTNYHDRLRADATQPYATERHPGPEAVGLDTTSRPAPEIGDGLGVLSVYPITGTERVPWTGCFGGFDTSDGGAADCLAMKGFLLTRLELADGTVVDLYDLHGEAGGSESDQILQAANYEQLAAYIAEHSEGRAVIVGGDTNLHTDMEHPDGSNGADIEIWDAFLEAAGLTDSCAATGCDDPGRIDKVAYRSGGGVEREATSHDFQTEVFVDQAGADLSDHQALQVEFSWQAS